VKSWPNLSVLVAAVLLLPLGAFAAGNTSPTPSPTPKAKAKSSPAPANATASPGKADSDADKEDAALSSLPENETYYGLHLPHFNMWGKLLMLFDAKSAKRIDQRDIEMQDLKIEIHNDDGTTFHVEMAHSVFNLDTHVLKSDTPTTIRRDDFVITGDKAEFDTKQRTGRMEGATKMIINSGNTSNTTK
jgi:hypothetical protein